MSRIWRQYYYYRKFRVDFRNHCLQAEIMTPHCQINNFQNCRQEVTVTKYNPNKRPKTPFKHSNITDLWMHNSLPALFLLNCSYRLYKFKMADKMAIKLCFYHNLRLVLGFWVIFWEKSFTLC